MASSNMATFLLSREHKVLSCDRCSSSCSTADFSNDSRSVTDESVAESVTDESVAELVADSSGVDREDTLLFLDWDNTLFPSTEVFQRWGLPKDPEAWSEAELSNEQCSALRFYADALLEYLTFACEKSGRVAIVTNSRAGWVEACLAFFAPQVLPLLEQGVRVVYAREIAQRCADGNPRPVRKGGSESGDCSSSEEWDAQFTAWKCSAMRREARRFFRGRDWLNIVSVGDSQCDADAARELAFSAGSCGEGLRTKTLTYPQERTIAQMTTALRTGTPLLNSLIAKDEDHDVVLTDKPHSLGEKSLCLSNLAARRGVLVPQFGAKLPQQTSRFHSKESLNFIALVFNIN